MFYDKAMAIITALEPQKRRTERFNIFIDGQFAFAASMQTVITHHLKVNQTITADQISQLVKENNYGLLLDKTLRWLGVRPRSEKELTTYLHKPSPTKEPNSEWAITMVIDRVKELGYIDDLAFAQWYVESRQRARPRGKRLLTLELRQKGIDQDTIEEATRVNSEADDAESSNSETAQATKAAQKKLASYSKFDKQIFYQKLGAYLTRRGFSWEVIKPVIDQLWQNR